MNKDVIKASLELFKTIPVLGTKELNYHPSCTVSYAYLATTLRNGYMFHPTIVNHFNLKEIQEIQQLVEKNLSITPEQLNSSFHKSWKKISEAPIQQLLIEQMFHYITTYGFKSLGIFDSDLVYIPKENLTIPEIDFNEIPIFNIKLIFKDELQNKVLKLLETKIALKEETLQNLIIICKELYLYEDQLNNINNKEAKIRIFAELDLVPSDAVEFLRLLIFKITGNSLLIKSKEVIDQIKTECNAGEIYYLINKYSLIYGPERLAAIFYRFKLIFLAFRQTPNLKSAINQIRRLAVKFHEPMKEDYLNNVTSNINKGIFDIIKLEKELRNVNIFRKIRLLYALNFRIKCPESIMYKIRNGKSFATKFKAKSSTYNYSAADSVFNSICSDMRNKFKDKKIFIPDFINYALPSTEKQFTGYFPSGTSIHIPTNMILGIHWVNTHRSIDLDLSLLNLEEKFGWDADWKNEDNSMMFSGDLTDAPKPDGAVEYFYIQSKKEKNYLLYNNYYNYDKDDAVDYKILVGKQDKKDLSTSYIMDPNDMLAIATCNMDKKQKVLGLLQTSSKGSTFYFSESYIGNSITSNSSQGKDTLNYFNTFYRNTISLNAVLEQSGAIIINNKNQKEKCDIDLSPEILQKDTIINLLKE